MSHSNRAMSGGHLRTASTLVAVVLVALLAGAALRSTPKPAVVAAVDLERLFNGLDEQAAADATLQALADEMNAEVDRRRRQIDELRDDLESFAAGSAAHRELSGRIELTVLELSSLVDFNRQKIEARRADYIRGLYLRIRESVAEISRRDGINIVFLDDTIPALERGDPNSILQQISARRMVFCDPSFDITDQVISHMNASPVRSGTPQ